MCGTFHRWECDISLCRVVISTLESQPPGLRMCSFHVECIVPIQAIFSRARVLLVRFQRLTVCNCNCLLLSVSWDVANTRRGAIPDMVYIESVYRSLSHRSLSHRSHTVAYACELIVNYVAHGVERSCTDYAKFWWTDV